MLNEGLGTDRFDEKVEQIIGAQNMAQAQMSQIQNPFYSNAPHVLGAINENMEDNMAAVTLSYKNYNKALKRGKSDFFQFRQLESPGDEQKKREDPLPLVDGTPGTENPNPIDHIPPRDYNGNTIIPGQDVNGNPPQAGVDYYGNPMIPGRDYYGNRITGDAPHAAQPGQPVSNPNRVNPDGIPQTNDRFGNPFRADGRDIQGRNPRPGFNYYGDPMGLGRDFYDRSIPIFGGVGPGLPNAPAQPNDPSGAPVM